MTRPSRIFFLCLWLVSETRAFAFIQRKSWKPRKKKVLSGGSSKQQVMEKELDRELLSISFFSFLHQAAMPFADLVDGSYLSTLDANSLGAVGVVRSSQNSVSKLYNSPLSKTTISLIASASGEEAREEEEQG
jgi:Na+-driven multidrug efflux pump